MVIGKDYYLTLKGLCPLLITLIIMLTFLIGILLESFIRVNYKKYFR